METARNNNCLFVSFNNSHNSLQSVIMSKIAENLSTSKKRGRGSSSAAKSTSVKVSSADETKKNKPAQDGQFDPSKIKGESTVIYLGHIPNKGFGEAEARKFFAQFGKVRRVKIFKSEKTGGSKGYGFVQFETNEVAVVVAEAMDGYFLSDRQLVCHVVPVNKLHEGMFLPPKQKKVEGAKATEEEQEEKEEEEDSEEKAPSQQKIRKLTRTQRKKQNKLKEMGIDFDF
jgi:nucleolar protein 15